MVWEGRLGGQKICDGNTRALVIKNVTPGMGVSKYCWKLRDVIYGRPVKLKKGNPLSISVAYLEWSIS